MRSGGQERSRVRRQPEPGPAARASGHDRHAQRPAPRRHGTPRGGAARAAKPAAPKPTPKPKPTSKPKPATPAPTAAEPSSPTPAATSTARSLAAGTKFSATTDAEVRSQKNKVGDQITATVANDVKDA